MNPRTIASAVGLGGEHGVGARRRKRKLVRSGDALEGRAAITIIVDEAAKP